MRTAREWTTDLESVDEQRAAGRYKPAMVLVMGERRHTLGCGSEDQLDVFRDDGGVVVVVSISHPLGYCGVEVFGPEGEHGELFLSSEEEIDDVLGPRGLDLSPINVAKRMADRISEVMA